MPIQAPMDGSTAALKSTTWGSRLAGTNGVPFNFHQSVATANQ